MISSDFHEFIESGVSVLVGTRSDRLLPECCRAVGARVESCGSELTVYLPVAVSEKTMENLWKNRRIAVCFARAMDHRSLQVKGAFLAVRDADEEDRRRISRYRQALAEAWGVIGVPPRITMRMAHWPCLAVQFQVEAVFNQTPGPGAGSAIGAPKVGMAS